MIDLLPDAPDPAVDLPAVFSLKAAAFVLAQKALPPQMNAMAANLNSIAFGGAYSISFLAAPVSGIGSVSGGKFALDGYSGGQQSTATILMLDTKSATGISIATMLDSMVTSNSSVRAGVKLTKQTDPNQFLAFNILGVAVYPNYRSYSVQSTGTGPLQTIFGDNDLMIASFTRTGDKGDAGALTPVIHVRDTKAAGTDGGTNQGNTVNKRALNTVVRNTISGASVSSDSIVLPAGVYRINARVPAFNVQSHQAMLYANGNVAAFGSSAYSSSNETDSILFIELVFSVTVTLEIYHYMQLQSVNTGFGKSALGFAGHPEIYTDVFIEKVS